ncbi:MAG: enoyl-CoA hydratase/isomerase family protein [Lysinibacillus sp.]
MLGGQSVKFEQKGEVGVIYLNEPEKMNALSMSLKAELLQLLEDIKRKDAIKILILTGNGKGFCAGGDIHAMQEPYDAAEIKRGMELSTDIIKKMRSLDQITISAVNGFAAGAGFSLALSTDLAIAEQRVKFIIAFKNVGLIPDLGLHRYLEKAVGSRKAKEWIFNGKTITAEEALDYGFVNHVVEDAQGMAHAMELAEALLSGPIEAFKVSKRLLNDLEEDRLEQVMSTETMHQVLLRGGEEHHRCLQQFLRNKTVKT